MSLYLILNLGVLAFPLLLSFDRRVVFFRRWPAVFVSSLTVGLVYLAWDVLATRRGDWWFNEQYVGTVRIFQLPLGEFLFFLTVPFSCLFIFEVVGAYFGDKEWRIPPVLWWAGLPLLLAAALLFRSQPYTCTVLISVALFLTLALWTPLLRRRQFWLYLGLSGLAFMMVNGVLTALPIVGYGEGAIWGIRIYTIPLEDFFYNFSLLGFNVLLYSLLRERLALRFFREIGEAGK